MRRPATITQLVACLCLLAGPAKVRAQVDFGSPLTGPPVSNAALSADATTTMWLLLADGTRTQRTATARYYRDRAGRLRIEQTLPPATARTSATEPEIRIIIHPNPANATIYTLDPVTRTAHPLTRSFADFTVGGGSTLVVPIGGGQFLVFSLGERLRLKYGLAGETVRQEPLGTRLMDGIEATGRRLTTTIPIGQLGNDHPMELVEERWESVELQMLVYCRSADPRTGVIEYRLTNLHRADPSPDLFAIPADFTLGTHPREPRISLIFAEPPRGAKGWPDKRSSDPLRRP
jgi:hypothetical protein